MKALGVVLAIALAITGCSKITHSRVATEADDERADGIRYFQASPYLIVHSDGKGGLSWSVVYLPDQTKKMIAKPFNLFAKLDSTLTFSNGVLTSAKDILTADAVPKAIVAAAEKVAPLLLGAARADIGEQAIPAPRIYKIVPHGNGDVEFFGGPADVPIKVTIQEGAK